jgi:hypothetical protein
MHQYHKNFIEGIKLLMASEELINMKEVATFLGIAYMSLWKIMEGNNKPTVEQCVILCTKGKFTANWMFTNKGPKTVTEELNFKLVLNKIEELNKKLS